MIQSNIYGVLEISEMWAIVYSAKAVETQSFIFFALR